MRPIAADLMRASVCLVVLGVSAVVRAQAPDGAAAAPAGVPIERLIEALSTDESYKVRLQAAVLLGRKGDERAVQPLIDRLNGDDHYTVRAAAATALANLAAARAVSHIVKRIATDNEEFVREEARRALGKYPRDAALPFAVAAYDSPDPRVRREAIAYLAAEPTPVAEPVLARALGDTPEVASLARAAVQKLAPADQLRFVGRAIEHREPSVRGGALDILVAMSTPEATQLVLSVYERDIEEEEVRAKARAALRKLKQHLPMAAVVKDAQKSPEKHTRARSLRLLGVVGGDEAEKVLVAALDDEDPYVQGIAVMAIGELGNPKVAPALEKLLEDPSNQRIIHLVRHTLKQLRAKKE